MKSNKLLILFLILTLLSGCGGGGGSSSSPTPVETLVSLSVTPTNPSLAKGAIQQFTATGTFADNSKRDLTTSVTWSSDAPSIATISSSGTATAVAAGTTTITAVSGNISGTATLTVTPATLLSIAISPTNPSIALPATLQFTATGKYSDGSMQDLTTLVTWSSAAPSIAAISNAGTATAGTAGTTTITAVLNNISNWTTLTVTSSAKIANNVLPISVNGSLCAANSYANKPCVSVTVCDTGTSSCQTITDILLDTGSYGLRIFKELLPATLQQTAGNSGLAECAPFGDGSSLWGSVQRASVILGNEPAVSVPIQVIDPTFGAFSPPAACSNARQTPAAAGYSGILGIGLHIQDCGSRCEASNNLMYYSCNGTRCDPVAVSVANQVQNPVALLPVDNNGVIVQLPDIPLGGVVSVDGRLVLGIDTQSNNASSGATAYAANQNAQFTTTFSGISYSSSFIDSGSNGLFFTSPSASLLPSCPNTSGWFCPPPPPVSLFAVNTAVSGSPIRVDFQIGHADDLFLSPNKVFLEVGANVRGGFDWGLPFFFGRNVYVGFEGSRSRLGTGPYWAY